MIYLVDALDRERIAESAEELKKELSYVGSDETAVPLLVFANKVDLPNAMTEDEIIDKLELRCMTNRPWHLQASSATVGTGLQEGIDWFTIQLEKRCDGETAAHDMNDNKA